MKMGAAMGTGLVASSRTAGTVRLANPLEHERRREDRVRQQHHDDDPERADRCRDRLVHDEAQAQPDPGQDQEGVDEEEADTTGHAPDTLDHAGGMVPPVIEDDGY